MLPQGGHSSWQSHSFVSRQAESPVGAGGSTTAMPRKPSQNSWGGLQRLSSSIIFLSQHKVRDSGDRDGLEKIIPASSERSSLQSPP